MLVASPPKRIDPAVRLPQFDPKARHPQATAKEKRARGATGVSALSNSQNIAKLLTRIILRVVLLPWNEVKPASGITACELPSSEKLRQSKMTGAALSLLLDVVRKNE